MECVIVHDLFLNETANYAHVFLPGSTFLEKNGTFTNAERRIQPVRKVMEPLAGVAEVAAFAVPSDIPGGEDEVMLAVVALPGAALTPEQVVAHADRVLPRFARPRYVALVGALPRTATGKLQRAALRRQGSAQAWDRERA
jgi:anaerobic selenocysteine-containing dehydrogenase